MSNYEYKPFSPKAAEWLDAARLTWQGRILKGGVVEYSFDQAFELGKLDEADLQSIQSEHEFGLDEIKTAIHIIRHYNNRKFPLQEIGGVTPPRMSEVIDEFLEQSQEIAKLGSEFLDDVPVYVQIPNTQIAGTAARRMNPKQFKDLLDVYDPLLNISRKGWVNAIRAMLSYVEPNDFVNQAMDRYREKANAKRQKEMARKENKPAKKEPEVEYGQFDLEKFLNEHQLFIEAYYDSMLLIKMKPSPQAISLATTFAAEMLPSPTTEDISGVERFTKKSRFIHKLIEQYVDSVVLMDKHARIKYGLGISDLESTSQEKILESALLHVRRDNLTREMNQVLDGVMKKVLGITPGKEGFSR